MKRNLELERRLRHKWNLRIINIEMAKMFARFVLGIAKDYLDNKIQKVQP